MSRRSALLLLILAVGCGCGADPDSAGGIRPAPGVAGGPPFDILVVVLDACRADRLGAYGYERPTTPHLDALASGPDAVVYASDYVEGNWTKPSTASLFTGLYVHQHGVRLGHETGDDGQWSTQVLADEHVTLAERLRALGFATFAVAKSWHLVPEYGFAQGFDRYLGPREVRSDRERVAATLRLVRELDRPFFGYLHLNACHHPFPEHERDPAFMRRFGGGYPEAARIAEGVDFTTSDIKKAITRGRISLEPADVRYLSVLYDAQLRRVDEVLVAPLLEGLRRSGRFDRTLLIVTADHGEELYEHRGYAHAGPLWNEVIHVPLIVKFPAGRRPASLPDRVLTPVSNVDLHPSLLAWLGAPVPANLPGRPILERPQPGFAFSQAGSEWAVIEGHAKLIVRDGRPWLFDLATDPREQRDLAAARPAAVGRRLRLGQQVFARGASRPDGPDRIETTLSPEALANLRALGYLE